MRFYFEVPIKTESTTNRREHWAVKAKRTAGERRAVAYRWPHRAGIRPVVTVTLIRQSPRELDDDNLRAALKGIRDGVASKLRVDDRTPLVEWIYRQVKGEPAVLINIEVAG